MRAEFYTGSYAHAGEESILHLCADFERGTWTKKMADGQAECPSWLAMHPNGSVLYAVRELTEDGALYTFAVENGALRLIGTQPTHGRDPCYLSLNETGEFLVAVNYTGSSVSVFRLDREGVPVERTEHITHVGSGPHPTRQEAAHPHCAVHANGLIYLCDLGMDRVVKYQLDRQRGKLRRTGEIVMPSGCGPRHLCVSPADENVLYVVGELSGCVYVVRDDKVVQQVSTLPEAFAGQSTAAAIKLSADAGVLFVSNRGHDSIAVLRILPRGMLERTHICKTGGKTPRDFAVFGNYLVTANQDSDSLTVLRFDARRYELEQTDMTYSLIRPTMILNI